MGLLDKLWDDTLAGPRPDTGLSRLRKHAATFAFRSSGGAGKDEAMDVVAGGLHVSVGDPSPEEEAPRVTRSIMIKRPPGCPSPRSGTPPASPAGSTPPVSPFSPGHLLNTQITPATFLSFSDVERRRRREPPLSSPSPTSSAAAASREPPHRCRDHRRRSGRTRAEQGGAAARTTAAPSGAHSDEGRVKAGSKSISLGRMMLLAPFQHGAYQEHTVMRAASVPISPAATLSNPRRFPRRPQALRISSDHSCFEVRKVSYRPPGTDHNLLNEVSFSLPQKSFGLIFGRSGSGKTTLLQILAGLSKPTSGSICIQKYGSDGRPICLPETLSTERVGIVFQFPERYFLADTVLEEVTFGWPRQKADLALREKLARKLQYAVNSVGLNTISLDEDPHSLSGGFKRRLALAIQLVQTPDLLVLDEPLAGLDWKARADVVKLLRHLKKQVSLLVVSHDLKELSPLVDLSWRMEMGGVLKEEPLPV